MCGRYYVDADMAEEISRMVRQVDRKIREEKFDGDIYPTCLAPVIDCPEEEMRLTCKRWGYPAHQGSGVVINARSETVLDKKMFQSGIRHHRIVIPARGFYEWNRRKEKNTFRREDATLVYMAGFSDWFEGEERFTILTTAANESMVSTHDRMPLILEEGQLTRWLTDDGATFHLLRQRPVALERYVEYEQQTLF